MSVLYNARAQSKWVPTTAPKCISSDTLSRNVVFGTLSRADSLYSMSSRKEVLTGTSQLSPPNCFNHPGYLPLVPGQPICTTGSDGFISWANPGFTPADSWTTGLYTNVSPLIILDLLRGTIAPKEYGDWCLESPLGYITRDTPDEVHVACEGTYSQGRNHPMAQPSALITCPPRLLAPVNRSEVWPC
jgi:hypothetical protein